MRLTEAAAFRYASSSVGDSACTSAMLSKFALFVSSGRKSPAFTSMPSRSRTTRSYSERFSRWKVRAPGFGCDARSMTCFHRLDERLERVARRTRRAGQRHHLRAQLSDHLLRRRQLLVGRGDVELLERQIAGHQIFVMAILAIRLDDAVERAVEMPRAPIVRYEG